MITKSRIVLALAFVAAFLVAGIPYWQIPYSKIALPNAILNLGLIIVAILAALSRIASKSGFWASTLIVGSSVPAAVMVRVMHDTALNPSSHNLWPFEIILSAGPGYVAALAGAAVGALAGNLLARRKGA